MNKKDCESIGYILSITAHDDYLRQLLFQLDPRIEPEYIGFEDVAGRNDEVNVRFKERSLWRRLLLHFWKGEHK